MKKQMLFKTKGMNQDLSVSAFNPEFSFENINLRLSTNDGNTLMSWVNEKGTSPINIYKEEDGSPTQNLLTIEGTPIGTAIIGCYLIIFTVKRSITETDYDYIYRLKYTDETKTVMQGKIICQSIPGYMNLSADHPLETLVSYESDAVQKVYWVDGINQPRVINICKDYGVFTRNNRCTFDFVRELQLNETVTVVKQLGASGMFAPGVIQYAFTYYDKYGQESNIFYTTPLYYISNADRGAAPDDKVENAFKITVTGVDKSFEFLRIYSIQRTSINGTPLCKRIQDIDIKNLEGTSVSYTDTGLNGDTVDPTELLYKGGEEISAGTLEQKDNTLFLGDIHLTSEMNETALDGAVYDNSEETPTLRVGFSDSYRTFIPNLVSSGGYAYANQLTSLQDGETVPCGGFKNGDTYRLGVQFQYKTGKWSKPVFLQDYTINAGSINSNKIPFIDGCTVYVPTVTGILDNVASADIYDMGYRKARAVVVFPEMQDRNVICQGVACPTLSTTSKVGGLDAQSSWFFRPYIGTNQDPSDGSVEPVCSNTLPYTENKQEITGTNEGYSTYNPANIRQVEIQGVFKDEDKFKVENTFLTLHSPDIEFDDQLSIMNFTSVTGNKVGYVTFNRTLSDINIQTETPTISNNGGGFIHKSFNENGMYGIVSGLFFDDYCVDDNTDNDKNLMRWDRQRSSFKWMVYLWNREGSLNNDINRPADRGTRTALLRKKVVSNLRYTSTTFGTPGTDFLGAAPQLFSSDEVSVVKFENKMYQGNIDTMLVPSISEGYYFAFGSSNNNLEEDKVDTSFTHSINWKLFVDDENGSEHYGFWHYQNSRWEHMLHDIGNTYIELNRSKEPIRMKYKSSPHLVLKCGSGPSPIGSVNLTLPIVEIRSSSDAAKFGGNSSDALMANNWIPCGKPVKLKNGTGQNVGKTVFEYSYGDTYFQRYDCLKTYPFTHEDTNQLVEIGSFMLETRVNIDGRYDRNRGQLSNLYMTPQNFNLINPVYSQIDNFFTYKIMDNDHYSNINYPNQVTWTLAKDSGAEIDKWTNITLASVLELDGNMGRLNKLIRFNNYLFAFQDTGISQILYNDNVQIQSTQGVPIEIANSGKVLGKDYKSNTIGCANKWSMVTTPNGIYFMDSNDKSIYLFNGRLNNVSVSGGFNAWCKKNIPSTGAKWNPIEFENFRSFYDRLNQEVLFVGQNKALAFSEKLNAFTSFYSYEEVPFMCNIEDTNIWISLIKDHEADDGHFHLWKHQAGDYCNFFGRNRAYSMTLVGNPEPQTDKIFTNLEFRACVDGDGEYNDNTGKFTPTLPFDSLEAWDEYQHGYTALDIKSGHSLFKHGGDDSALIRKFRIWRCDIPRNNKPLPVDPEDSSHTLPEIDAEKGIYRHVRKPSDRMRNPWVYLQLHKNPYDSIPMPRVQVHDILMTYFN